MRNCCESEQRAGIRFLQEVLVSDRLRRRQVRGTGSWWSRTSGASFGTGLTRRLDECRSFAAQVVTSCEQTMTETGYFRAMIFSLLSRMCLSTVHFKYPPLSN